VSSGNDGFRLVIDRHGPSYFWSFTLRGHKSSGLRGHATVAAPVEEAEAFRDEIESGQKRKSACVRRASQ
jgi:hypothetical protein